MDLQDVLPSQDSFINTTSINKYSDILKLRDSFGIFKLKQLVNIAFRKFATEDILLSNVQEVQHQVFGWMSKSDSYKKHNLDLKDLNFTEGNFFIYDFFPDSSRNSDIILELVDKGICEAKKQNAKRITVIISKNNEKVFGALKKLGLEVNGKLTIKTILQIKKLSNLNKF